MDVSEWNTGRTQGEDGIDQSLLEEGRWRCLRRVRSEDSYCIFHSDGCPTHRGESHTISPSEVFCDIVNGNTRDRGWNQDAPDGLWEVPRQAVDSEQEYQRRTSQFIGASFEQLSLDGMSLDPAYGTCLDLRLSRIRDLIATNAEIDQSIKLSGAEGGGNDSHWSFADAEINGQVKLTDSSALDSISFAAGSIAAGIDLRYTATSGVVDCRGVDCGGDLDMSAATIGGQVQMWNAEIDGSVLANCASLQRGISCFGSTIGGELLLCGTDTESVGAADTVILDVVKITDTSIDGRVDLDEVDLKSDCYLDCGIARDASIKRAEIGGDLEIGGRINDGIDIEDTIIDKTLSITGSIAGGIDATGVSAGSIHLISECEVGTDFIFIDAFVDADIRITNVTIDGDIVGRRADVHGSVEIIDTSFNGQLSLEEATISDNLSLETTTVESQAVFTGASGTGMVVQEMTINNTFNLRDVVFDSIEVKSTSIGNSLLLDGATVESVLVDKNTTIAGRISCNKASFSELAFHCVLTHPAVDAVSLVNSSFRTATFGVTSLGIPVHNGLTTESEGYRELKAKHELPPASAGLVYDLTEATLGEINVVDTRTPILKALHVPLANFEDFPFENSRKLFEDSDYALHRSPPNAAENIGIVSQHLVLSVPEGDHRNCEGPVFDVAQAVAAELIWLVSVEAAGIIRGDKQNLRQCDIKALVESYGNFCNNLDLLVAYLDAYDPDKADIEGALSDARNDARTIATEIASSEDIEHQELTKLIATSLDRSVPNVRVLEMEIARSLVTPDAVETSMSDLLTTYKQAREAALSTGEVKLAREFRLWMEELDRRES